MAIYRHSGQGGTDEDAVTVANSGGDSGDPWDGVNKGAGSAVDYDSAQAAHGTIGYRFIPASSQVAELRQNVPSVSQVLASIYMRIPSAFSVLSSFLQVRDSSQTIMNLALGTDRRVRVIDDANSTIFTSSASSPLAVNLWNRIECRVVPGPTGASGTIELAYYVGDSTSAIEVFSSSTVNAGTNPVNNLRFGRTSGATTDTTTFWMDSLQIATAADAASLGLVWPAVSNNLVVDDSLQPHTAESPTLQRIFILSPAKATHTHTVEAPTLAVTTPTLVVNKARHSVVSDSPSLGVSLGTVVGATNDLKHGKLRASYGAPANTSVGELLTRYRSDNALEKWEDYVAHIAPASPSPNVGDDDSEFWDDFVP